MIEVGWRFAMIRMWECFDRSPLSIDSDLAPDTSEAAIEVNVDKHFSVVGLHEASDRLLIGFSLALEPIETALEHPERIRGGLHRKIRSTERRRKNPHMGFIVAFGRDRRSRGSVSVLAGPLVVDLDGLKEWGRDVLNAKSKQLKNRLGNLITGQIRLRGVGKLGRLNLRGIHMFCPSKDSRRPKFHDPGWFWISCEVAEERTHQDVIGDAGKAPEKVGILCEMFFEEIEYVAIDGF